MTQLGPDQTRQDSENFSEEAALAMGLILGRRRGSIVMLVVTGKLKASSRKMGFGWKVE